MRTSLRLTVLVLVLLAAFAAGWIATPSAEAGLDPSPCYILICAGGEEIICCQASCTCPPQCAGDPPVCW